MSMIEGYAYALKIDGAVIKPWITGEDGALREVNLARCVHRHEETQGVRVRVAQIIDQRISRVMVRYPVHTVFADGQEVSYA